MVIIKAWGIEDGPGTVGTHVVDKSYPYEEGLSGAVTRQIDNPYLEEE